MEFRESLGERIRSERLARGWSLAQLAAASGVSKAMISRVERGESSPTAELLGKLSGAFVLSMSSLIARSEEQWVDPASGYTRRAIATAPEFPVDVTEVNLPAGAHVEFPASSYAFNSHLVWVIDGTLTLQAGTTRHQLLPRESLQISQPVAVRFENDTTKSCRYLVLVAPRGED
jgi:transcriptional regulator with XRE-family HTH domain